MSGNELQSKPSGQQPAISDRKMAPEFLETGSDEHGVLI